MMEYINQILFLLINPVRVPCRQEIIVFEVLASMPLVLVPACLGILWLFDIESKRLSFLAAFNAVTALSFNYLISEFWFHNRPFADHIGINFIHHVNDSSFPSDHVTLMASVGLVLYFSSQHRILGSVFLGLSLITGWARIYAGIHYPFDIVGSYLVVCFTFMLFRRYLDRLIEPLFQTCERFYSQLIHK